MEFVDVIRKRRSIRKFKPDPVSDAQIQELLEAARLAPSGLNLQPWRFVVVKSEDVRKKIEECITSKNAYNAPLMFVCCMDLTAFSSLGTRLEELQKTGAFSNTVYQNYTPDDFLDNKNVNEIWIKMNLAVNVAISIEHILLKTTDSGLGCCWLGSFDQKRVKELTGIGENYEVLALLAIGYPDQQPPQRPRLSCDEIVLSVL